MYITELRSEIDKIDDELLKLFCARMEISAQVADYKRERNLPIFVPAREREILQAVGQKAGAELAGYARSLYSTIFELSRSYQAKRNGAETPLFREITAAIKRFGFERNENAKNLKQLKNEGSSCWSRVERTSFLPPSSSGCSSFSTAPAIP